MRTGRGPAGRRGAAPSGLSLPGQTFRGLKGCHRLHVSPTMRTLVKSSCLRLRVFSADDARGRKPGAEHIAELGSGGPGLSPREFGTTPRSDTSLALLQPGPPWPVPCAARRGGPAVSSPLPIRFGLPEWAPPPLILPGFLPLPSICSAGAARGSNQERVTVLPKSCLLSWTSGTVVTRRPGPANADS